MANTRLDKSKPFITLAIFLIAWWALPFAIKSFLRASFAEFQAPVWIVSSNLDDFGNSWSLKSHSKEELIQAGKEIARQKAFYQLTSQQNKTLEMEVERLESILNMPKRSEFRYEFARVIRRDLNMWWQHITIRKGKNYGITKGAAVVFNGGVVGRIVEVHSFTSQVELITSPNFRIAASFENDNRPLIYQGAPQHGFGAPIGEVHDAPKDLKASSQKPLRLLSTGLGGTFPAGLVIGYVTWLEPGRSGIFQTGEVQLDDRLLNLQEVSVLIPMAADPTRNAL